MVEPVKVSNFSIDAYQEYTQECNIRCMKFIQSKIDYIWHSGQAPATIPAFQTIDEAFSYDNKPQKIKI